MTTTPPPGPTRTPRGFGIDPRLGAAALRVPAASREDSHTQAFLKFHHTSSLDYKARHGLLVDVWPIYESIFAFKHGTLTHQTHGREKKNTFCVTF